MNNLFLTNYTEQTFLDRLRENLRRCQAFSFSVSFIKKAGLVLLIKDIEAALARGCKGRLITSTYQNFTDIESLQTFLNLLSKYPGFECHLDYESFHDDHYSTLGYHSKGYLFEFQQHCEIIIGSSNITRYALLKNIEWDLLLSDSLDSDVYKEALLEFEDRWQGTMALDTELIRRYSMQLNYAIERWDMDYERIESRIKPNYMQRTALKELNRYRAMGIGRALITSAVGSGKTYLAAFDALNFNPKRLLFVVHESSILKKALESFQEVFGPDVYCGLYTGESKEMDADFLFSTNVSMARNLELFSKDTFDYIIIDECHHAVAESYKKIVNYFEPEFLLGLTATPERMDNQDVFDIFDHNVPYELRLRDAIINDLVVPFRYFGIRDKLVDYGLTGNMERKMLAQIADSDHCAFIHDEIEKHRPAGKLKALAFCRNITHARQMADALGEYYHTAYLTGKNTVGERIRAYNDLQSEQEELEILCSVDVLNEGVDIPGVNMILFLRPTESATIFIQQLGRGLRKFANKSYVTVLDFIGNSYRRSVQIAFALGSLSQNFVLEKRLMMSMVQDDFRALGLADYGVEIHIDDLSKEEISDFLEKENFNSLNYLKQDYMNFKKYINSPYAPLHMDYLNNDCAPDLLRFMNAKIGGKKNSCYYNFLAAIGEEDLPIFTELQVEFLKYMSNLLPLVRPHEYLVVDLFIKKGDATLSYEEILAYVKVQNPEIPAEEVKHALKYMVKRGALDQYGASFVLRCELDEQFVEHLKDLMQYGFVKYNVDLSTGEEDEGFFLWKSYSKDKVQLKLLKNPGDIMKGTCIYDKTIIIFVSLKKDASVEERLAYKDKYLTPDLFQWESENNIGEKALNSLIESEKALIFVRKVSDEHGIVQPFIYCGTGKLTNPRRQEKIDSTTGKPANTVLFDVVMKHELPDYLQYDFGVSEMLS